MRAPLQTSPACWSQPSGMASKGSWDEESHDNWSQCASRQWSKVPVTLLLLLCLFCIHRNPICPCVLSLAMAGFTFLLSITIALGIFSVPESFCHQLGSWDVTAGLKVPILLAFTATVSCLTALSAVTALFVLPVSCWPCNCSQCFLVLLCALLWLLSFLLTVTLHFCPLVPMVLVLSCLFSVLTLACFALALLCPAPAAPVISFPFFTADFGHCLLLSVFDFSLFAPSTSLLLACAKSSAHPLIYFLAGSCAKEFTPSVSVAFQRSFEDIFRATE
uniref:MAS protein n=1 Tax=Serinus canaria TaxID=9135 RepID=A0A8C9N4T7_SERCA